MRFFRKKESNKESSKESSCTHTCEVCELKNLEILKDCPFCGKQPKIEKYSRDDTFLLKCCDMITTRWIRENCKEHIEFLKKWNTRHDNN